MKCEFVIEAIPLYLYGELAGEQEEAIEAHVHDCQACRREMEGHRALHQNFDREALAPSAVLLADCRRELRESLQAERGPGRAGWLSDLKRDIRGTWWLSLRPLGALALVALGFFGNQIMTRSRVPLDRTNGGTIAAGIAPGVEPVFSAVRSVQPDSSGRVHIALDETRRRNIVGKPDDENIARLLLTAVRDEANVGLRVESVEMLKRLPPTAEVRQALLVALRQDSNPGVRLKALDALKEMGSDPDVRKTLAQVLLSDTNPGVRIQAIDLLVSHRDAALVGVLQNLVSREDNNYVRLRCKTALEEMNASVGTF
ncbi:MAG: HEAT repeat domain-containing protein [Bryobacteraceae bacterium]